MSAGTPPLKRRLRTNHEYLVTELRVSNYLDALFQAEVISSEDMVKLRGQSDRYEQSRYLLGILSGKPEAKIEKFLEIVKTREDMQPHIYWELFPEEEKDKRDDSKQVTVGEAENHDVKFESVVSHCLDKLLSTLESSYLADHLRSKQLINREDYRQVTSFPTEEERARLLLQDILPKKGPGIYAKFREVLLTVQENIVLDILDPTERSQVAQGKDESCTEPPRKKKKQQPPLTASNSLGEEDTNTVESEEEEDEDLCPFLDKRVDADHIAAVKKWGNERWRPLGRSLGFLDPDISDIESQFEREGTREKLHQIIHRWQQREGADATLRALLEACKDPDVKIYGNVVAEIKTQQKKKGKKRSIDK